MGKAKITVTGTAEKQPKINKDGTVDLLFKISMSPGVPKGLKTLGDSFALVHVAPKTWKKVSDEVKDDSFFIVQGEAKASKNSKDTPFFEVVCFDISLKEPAEKKELAQTQSQPQHPKEQPKPKPEPVKVPEPPKKAQLPIPEKPKREKPKMAASKEDVPERQETIKWYTPDEIITINTADVVIFEEIHLLTKVISLNGILKAVSVVGELNKPIGVKPLENGKYALVMGLRSYAAAKMLNLEKVPAVIRDITHKEWADNCGLSDLEKKTSKA